MAKFANWAALAYSWLVRVADDALTYVLKKSFGWFSYLIWLAGEDLGKYRLKR